MEKIFGCLFAGVDGDTSSKRVAAFLLIILGIIYSFIHPLNWQIVLCFISNGTALLGVAAITHT
jgi:hypothetical protein